MNIPTAASEDLAQVLMCNLSTPGDAVSSSNLQSSLGLAGLCVPSQARLPPVTSTLELATTMPDPTIVYPAPAFASAAAASAYILEGLRAALSLAVSTGLKVPSQQVVVATGSIVFHLFPSPPLANSPSPPRPNSPVAHGTSASGFGRFSTVAAWKVPIMAAMCSGGCVVLVLVLLAAWKVRRMNCAAQRKNRPDFPAKPSSMVMPPAPYGKPDDSLASSPRDARPGPKEARRMVLDTDDIDVEMTLGPPARRGLSTHHHEARGMGTCSPQQLSKSMAAVHSHMIWGGASFSGAGLARKQHTSRLVLLRGSGVEEAGTVAEAGPSCSSKSSTMAWSGLAGHGTAGRQGLETGAMSVPTTQQGSASVSSVHGTNSSSSSRKSVTSTVSQRDAKQQPALPRAALERLAQDPRHFRRSAASIGGHHTMSDNGMAALARVLGFAPGESVRISADSIADPVGGLADSSAPGTSVSRHTVAGIVGSSALRSGTPDVDGMMVTAGQRRAATLQGARGQHLDVHQDRAEGGQQVVVQRLGLSGLGKRHVSDIGLIGQMLLGTGNGTAMRQQVPAASATSAGVSGAASALGLLESSPNGGCEDVLLEAAPRMYSNLLAAMPRRQQAEEENTDVTPSSRAHMAERLALFMQSRGRQKSQTMQMLLGRDDHDSNQHSLGGGPRPCTGPMDARRHTIMGTMSTSPTASDPDLAIRAASSSQVHHSDTDQPCVVSLGLVMAAPRCLGLLASPSDAVRAAPAAPWQGNSRASMPTLPTLTQPNAASADEPHTSAPGTAADHPTGRSRGGNAANAMLPTVRFARPAAAPTFPADVAAAGATGVPTPAAGASRLRLAVSAASYSSGDSRQGASKASNGLQVSAKSFAAPSRGDRGQRWPDGSPTACALRSTVTLDRQELPPQSNAPHHGASSAGVEYGTERRSAWDPAAKAVAQGPEPTPEADVEGNVRPSTDGPGNNCSPSAIASHAGLMIGGYRSLKAVMSRSNG